MFKQMDSSELSLDFVNQNKDVLELFKSMGEGMPKFYVFNSPKEATKSMNLLLTSNVRLPPPSPGRNYR